MKYYTLFLWSCFVLFNSHSSTGQVFLQLEEVNKVHAIKFPVYSVIHFMTTDDPNNWKTREIEDINYDKNLIYTFDKEINVSDINYFQIRHNWAKYAEYSLYTFGATWTGLGLLGTAGGTPFTQREMIIAGSSVVTGYIIGKLFYKQKYKIGTKNRLRIIDTNFY